MNKHFRSISLNIILTITIVACTPPTLVSETQPSSEAADMSTSVSEESTWLLPRSLYFLSYDNQGIHQVYRMERDGNTKTQLTFEHVNVDDYDVSLADGSIAYIASNQLLMTNADSSNHRVLFDGGLVDKNNPLLTVIHSAVFSPDGGTLAYAYRGVNLYDFSTGASNLVIDDQLEKPEIINGVEQSLPIETYSPERYSPDGTKLLINLGYFEGTSAAVYDPASKALVRFTDKEGSPISYYGLIDWSGWSGDGSSVYAAVPIAQFHNQSGEIWWVDAATGTVTTLFPFHIEEGVMKVPFPDAEEPYLAPDGQLYYFFGVGTYSVDSAFFELPVLQLVRSAPDGVTGRTVLRPDTFELMNEALWAPDASFVVVAIAPIQDVYQGGQAAIFYFDERPPVVLTPFAQQMKWGP